MLLNPKKESYAQLDPASRALMQKTIAFFEQKGKTRLKEDDHARVWNYDFVDFVRKEKAFATLMTPAGYGPADARWDTFRICAFNEILGFYGLCYWYTWQVSMLGLGPIWMSQNEEIKQRTAQLLEEGAVFAFGLSEKEHGADLYASEMTLTPDGDDYRADGSKYYIGNANEAALVSTFGKLADSGDYVFFAVDSQHERFDCVRNVVNSQNYVAEFRLDNYPITDADILSRGRNAWDASLNTINVCKVNLGWAAIGMCTHAYYEAITHAAHRRLFGHSVTDFPHIKQLFVDAYARLVAMKLFALRAADYMRSASSGDRRYLLYNPLVKMKVTTQGEEVINLLWDVIAAKGFEKDTIFDMVTRDIRALPKLEGTVHVNMALVVKFMANYFFSPAEFPEIPWRTEPVNDDFLFNQGPTKGLGEVQFHDYELAYGSVDLPNVRILAAQIALFKAMLFTAPPTEEQTQDIDFLLNLGELFTLVAYGQLIIENARIYAVEDDLLDQIFDFMIRDFSKYALQLYSKTSSTEAQMDHCLKMIRKPVVNPVRFDRIWRDQAYALADAYAMQD
jgi:acyl-CoA dehydrogenase